MGKNTNGAVESPKDTLRVDVSNFGPIAKGKIGMKPLTVIMGPNNSGKSYAATLIYSFLSSHAVARNRHLRRTGQRLPEAQDGARLPQNIKKLMLKDSTIPPAQANSLASRAFAPIWKDAIEHSFGSPVTDLIRVGQKTAKITVTGSDVHELKIADDARISVKFDDATVHKVKIAKERVVGEGESSPVLYVDKRLSAMSPKFIIRHVDEFLLGSLRPQFGHAHYLPATRSGILQGHRVLAASLVQHATRAGIDPPEMPRLTKAVSEFIADLIDISSRPGQFTALAEDLERDLLGGRIALSQADKHSAPNLVYELADGNVPLHRTSSTVSELAPLSVYLKYIVRTGDLLIIEEPEAHLHMSNQILFAKHVARMIRNGLKLLITTHSFALMESLNNYLIAGGMDPASRRSAGIDEGDYLLRKEVSPHLCSKDGKGGHVIAPIEMDEHGISLQEFIDVTKPTYELGIKMDEWVEKNGS